MKSTDRVLSSISMMKKTFFLKIIALGKFSVSDMIVNA